MTELRVKLTEKRHKVKNQGDDYHRSGKIENSIGQMEN